MRAKKKKLEYDFLSAWKTDDKEWVKKRRSDWKYIKIQLNRMRDAEVGRMFNHLPKKNFRYLKNYFLTGKDKPEREKIEELVLCLNEYDSQYEAEVLLQFWLSADHSKQYLSFLKTFLEQEFIDEKKHRLTPEVWEKEKLKCSSIYEKSSEAYRRTIGHYNGTEKYKWEGETNVLNGPIFGDLEPEMLDLFALTARQKSYYDNRVKEHVGVGIYKNRFEGVLAGYFGSTLEKNSACFNPHNPVRYMLGEYERWGVPAKRTDTQDRKPFLISTALAWHVADTPEGRYPLQVEVALELKQRILDIRKKVPNEARERIGNAIKLYETGKFEQYL